MKYYKVHESANYCGYDDDYLIKSDKPFDEVEDYANDRCDNRKYDYDWEADDEDEDELEIGNDIEEIDEEEFIRLRDEDFYEVEEI